MMKWFCANEVNPQLTLASVIPPFPFKGGSGGTRFSVPTVKVVRALEYSPWSRFRNDPGVPLWQCRFTEQNKLSEITNEFICENCPWEQECPELSNFPCIIVIIIWFRGQQTIALGPNPVYSNQVLNTDSLALYRKTLLTSDLVQHLE